MEVQNIAVEQLVPNDWNPNVMPEADMKAMAWRFRQTGQVDKPLTVRPLGEGQYQIVDGEQTWTAAKKAGFPTVPCMVGNYDDVTAIATTFVKNLHGDMNPIKVGRNIIRMKGELAKIKGVDAEKVSNVDIGKMMSKSEGSVRNYLLYVEATNWLGVDGYPTEDELSKLSVKEVRDLVAQMKEGNAVPLPLTTEDGQSVAEATEEQAAYEAEAKTLDKIKKQLAKLSPEGRQIIKKELAKMIRDDNKGGETAAE